MILEEIVRERLVWIREVIAMIRVTSPNHDCFNDGWIRLLAQERVLTDILKKAGLDVN